MIDATKGYRLTVEDITKHAKEITKPVRRLLCACCAGVTHGRQWFNQDDGYGLCPSCADRIEARGNTDMPRTYGVRGVHYDLTAEASALDYLNGLICQGVEFPEAVYKAAQVYQMQQDDLTRAYDAQY